jgi:hypothetical protein
LIIALDFAPWHDYDCLPVLSRLPPHACSCHTNDYPTPHFVRPYTFFYISSSVTNHNCTCFSCIELHRQYHIVCRGMCAQSQTRRARFRVARADKGIKRARPHRANTLSVSSVADTEESASSSEEEEGTSSESD